MKPILAEVYSYFMSKYLKHTDMSIEQIYENLEAKSQKEGWQIPTLEEMKAWVERTLEVTSDRI